MNGKLPLRVASAVLVLIAAGHTYGFLKFRPPSAAGAAVLDAMNTVTFDVKGHSYSYGSFYLGFGLTISAYLLIAAYICWYLASLSPAQAKVAAPIAGALAAAQLASAVLGFRYFSLPPAVLSTVTAACLGWAALQLSRIEA